MSIISTLQSPRIQPFSLLKKPVYFLGFCFLLSLTSCGTSRPQASSSAQNRALVRSAKKYLGTPYRYGGTSRKGMDCSGLIYTAFHENKIELPRVSYKQAEKGKTISLSRVKAGDLLFFRTSGRRISHVGLVESVKNGIVYFIHASSSKGVTVSSMQNRYWKSRFVRAKRIR